MIGQVITTIEYKVERFQEKFEADAISLEQYLNTQANNGWLLHTIRLADENEWRAIYECIWQKFNNRMQGIIK